jgi:hypothetical protein
VPPSLDFVPSIYTPLYFYVCAGVARLIGLGLVPLRLVSIVSSVGCLLLIANLVGRQTHSRMAALLAAGLFAATYRIGGAWLDLARVDSLFLLLLLAGATLLRRQGSTLTWAAAGVLWALAFFTKQTTLIVAGPMMLYAFLSDRRRCWAFIGTFIVLVAGSTLVLDRLHDGWFRYYVFFLPGHTRWATDVFMDSWTVDLAPVALAFLAGAMALAMDLWSKDRRAFWFYVLLTAGAMGASFSTLLHEGGYANSLIPTFAAAAMLFGLGYEAVQRRLAERPGPDTAAYRTILNAAFLVQLLLLTYHPLAQVPSSGDRQAGEEFVASLRKIPGDVYVSAHPRLAQLAGKKPFTHQIAVQDVLRADTGPGAQALARELGQALQQHVFSCIVLDDDWLDDAGLQRCYRAAGQPFRRDDVFWPVTGRVVRPQVIYFPREPEGRNP